MITLPVPVVVAQWALLAGLAALVVLLYRQLAYLIRLGTDLHETAGGLEIGQTMPTFSYRPLARGARHDVAFSTDGSPTLLMLTDPRCSSCERTLRELDRETEEARAAGLRVLAVTDAHPKLVDAVPTYRRVRIDVGLVPQHVAHDVLKTHVTPYFYGVAPDGIIATRGTASDASQIRRLVETLLEGPGEDAGAGEGGHEHGAPRRPALVEVEGLERGGAP